ncbi:protein CREG2 isoform X2 [Symphalangus syndactylus]|uniref:protein CREG2 isoform X2 n=1 Tax=Symphalangus syndactylus TaxID=9590 RepID=UPI003005F293
MSVRRGRRPARPGTRLSWLLCCSALLSPAAGYVIVSSVSWAITNEVDEELDSASTEEAMPALLEDSSSIWQQSFPASAHKEDAHLRPRAGAARARPPPAPPGMFSYRREGGQAAGAPPGPRLRAATARSLAHASVWGCLATVSAHEKIQGLPFGNCLPISDGPFNNSTGIPFFYMTAKDLVVADLMKNPMASLMLPESEGEFCRKNIVDPEDPRCVQLTLTGQMIAVSPEEVEFAKQAMFSRAKLSLAVEITSSGSRSRVNASGEHRTELFQVSMQGQPEVEARSWAAGWCSNGNRLEGIGLH